MGYRSEIGILVTIPKTTSAKKILEKMFSKWDKNEFKDLFEVTKFNREHIKFVYVNTKYDLKWYECFEEVKTTMDFINDFNKHYKSGGIHYLRVGENYDDVDEIVVGDPFEYIHLHRYMEI